MGMRLLRLILAGLIALTVLVGGLFAAILVVVAGLVGYLVQRLRRWLGLAKPGRRPAAGRPSGLRTDDVIDI